MNTIVRPSNNPMTIPNTPSLLATSNPRLTQSADTLDSALAQFGKLAASIENRVVAPGLLNAGKGFDEWLASDIQYGALLYGDESPLNSSATSPLFRYPTSSQPLSYGSQSLTAEDLGLGPVEKAVPLGLTTTKLQQAAAVLNIPWSEELERAVLEQTKIPSMSPLNRSVSLQSPSSAIKTNNTSKRPHAAEEEESDEVLAKRVKNTDAARRSRLKKLIRLKELETKVAELETTNHGLNTRIAVLETEKNGFLIKEAEQNARIAQLETKIIEAHFALKTCS
ncbi:hypothetical protein BC939DRAFT_471698 [Gamsiella multidivaricata]|uniref:uncharacterized protein n=1 Tax=Gamsiella multidivaricata TaxID=101098 RepID=UPI00221F8095|nr:uncharacterized protein BC939DRAFT_471698 [Gamsiella multidivaricata]KAI7815782.1 hypothetical protein BC939DRAFT_471698 [Gamsiella multidivaricata]